MSKVDKICTTERAAHELLEAAHELLEAAIDMVAQVDAYDHVHGRDSCSIDPDGLRLAIAKAKGASDE